MGKLLFAWLALAAAAAAAPASAPAAPQSATAAADERFQAFGAWSQRVMSAMTPMNEASARFAALMQQMPPPSTDPAARAKQVATIRAAIAEARSAVARSRSQLAQIKPFEGEMPGVGNANVNQLLIDVKGQTDRMLAYMDDTEAFATAVARGDPAATQQSARKLIKGGFLLMESQAILYRGRQALFPRDQAPHQLIGVGLHLYRTMSVAADAWFQARITGDPKGAAQVQRARFLEIAGELEATLRDGRSNFAREMAFFRSQKQRAAKDPNLLRIIERVESVGPSYVSTFALGDELAAWLRTHAGTPGSALADQHQPQLVLALSGFEQRLIANGAEAAAAIAAK